MLYDTKMSSLKDKILKDYDKMKAEAKGLPKESPKKVALKVKSKKKKENDKSKKTK